MEKIESHAIVLKSYGKATQAFELRTCSVALPQADELLIEVEAFGLNYADVMARNKLYKEAPPLPAVLGYEVVGTVTRTGSETNASLLGKRVVAFTRFGGYARHAVTKASAVALIEDMPAAEALALSTQFVTAYYMAVYLSPVHAGDKVLIHAAAGGVGTALIQLAKWKKAFVYAKVSSAAKEELVKSLGADVVINYSKGDYAQQIAEHLQGKRLEVSFNPIAGSTFKKDFKLLGSGGRLIIFGGSERSGKKWGILSDLNFVRKMGLILPIALMMRSKNVLGVNMLKIADNTPEVLTECLQRVVELTREGILKPQIGGIFNATDIAEAHDLLESGKSTGKISVFWTSP